MADKHAARPRSNGATTSAIRRRPSLHFVAPTSYSPSLGCCCDRPRCHSSADTADWESERRFDRAIGSRGAVATIRRRQSGTGAFILSPHPRLNGTRKPGNCGATETNRHSRIAAIAAIRRPQNGDSEARSKWTSSEARSCASQPLKCAAWPRSAVAATPQQAQPRSSTPARLPGPA